MMVHFGEAQVFEGHMAHADDGRIDIHGAASHLLEQRAELFLVHEVRIPECAITPGGQPKY
jgi:hypothetical protein